MRSRTDLFAFVDYPPQTVGPEVASLRSRDGVKDLPAVVEGPFLNLSYSMWTAGPLNSDAAEQLRAALEQWGFAPPSAIRPRFPDDRLPS